VKTPTRDPPALARALETVLANRSYREQLAGRAQKWVRDHAALEANDGYLRLYRELLTPS
jgi:hypothetical protein